MWILEVFMGLSWLSIMFLLLGLALLIVEMFLPGFGVAGISGLVCASVGIVLGAQNLLEAVVLICVLLFVLGILLTIVLRSAAHGRLSKTLVLGDQLTAGEGFASNDDLAYFINREGVTLTPCHPAGTADFDGVKLDVVSESVFIPQQQPIRVIAVQGRRIVVRHIV